MLPYRPPPLPHDGVTWWPLYILISYTFVFLLAMLFLLCRSHKQPLKARSPGLLAVSSFGGYLQVIWITTLSAHLVNSNSENGCSFGAWAMTIGHPLLFIPYVLRCYRLHLIFNLTIEKESATYQPDNAVKYYHSRKHRISDAYLLRIMAVVCAAAVGVAAVDEYFLSHSALGSWQRLYVCNWHAKSFVAVWDAVRFLETLIFTVSLYKLWKVVDAFTIRMELVGVGGIWLGNLIVRVVLGIYHPEEELWVRAQPYAIVARSTVCLFASVIVPIAWSMLEKKRSGIILWADNAALRSLRDTLHDPEYVKAFQRFLVKRFSVENVLFWMEIELYRVTADGDAAFYNNRGQSDPLNRMYQSEDSDPNAKVNRALLQSEARAIVERYLMPEAHLALMAVDDATKVHIQRSVEAGICTADLFDTAQQMVYDYIKKECWEDFLNSSDCRRAMRKVKRQETIRSRLIGAGMMDRSV